MPPAQVHVEYFTATQEAALDGGYTVELSRSGKSLQVPGGKTVLQVLKEAGIEVAHSCEEGVCGACETRVLSGVPDHRDAILSEPEKAANNTMMICCSGCKGERLVLDL
ncbi:Phenoxybenzoate dioxygenase subunit beta [compost metagenome]